MGGNGRCDQYLEPTEDYELVKKQGMKKAGFDNQEGSLP
jgi:hypothetical protein